MYVAIKSYFGSQWILIAKPNLKTKQITVSLKWDHIFKNRRTTPHPHYEKKKRKEKKDPECYNAWHFVVVVQLVMAVRMNSQFEIDFIQILMQNHVKRCAEVCIK